jgi:hypothetical protein
VGTKRGAKAVVSNSVKLTGELEMKELQPDHPAKRIADLLPWNWCPQNLAAEAS